MKKQIDQKLKQKQNITSKNQHKFVYSILLVAYLLFPAFTPNFFTLDSNGTKFLAIAILNCISLILLYSDRDFRGKKEVFSGFFGYTISILYTLFLVVSLLSFFQAINISESILNFAKLFSVFFATNVLYHIFSQNRNYLLYVSIGFTLLLFFDCATVFYYIYEYVNKSVQSISEIKSIYSNKNILAAALFIKIPAAIWLIIFTDGWKKKLGYAAFMLGILAILFMSTRAFYVGIVLLVVALIAYIGIRQFNIQRSILIKRIVSFLGIFLLAIIGYTLVQRYLYPKSDSDYNLGIADRISTIKTTEASTSLRLATWQRSFRLIKENPVFGVGTGNWKIQVLKYESPQSRDYTISYKNHNDFIEVTAETGILGGILYVSLFILILINFIRSLLQRNSDQSTLKYLFLPAFGILAYSVDAFFNFPLDRPEIQILFATYVGMAIAFTKKPVSDSTPEVNTPFLQKRPKPIVKYSISVLFIALLSSSLYILILNVKSLHYQRYAYDDMMANKFSYQSSYFIKNFPTIPNISSTGAPINTYIAYYLLNEKRAVETIKMLESSNPSPFDSRREYYLSRSYDMLGNMDSTIYWVKKALELKPKHSELVFILNSRLFEVGRQKEAIQVLDSYLALVKNNAEAWKLAISQNMLVKDENKALRLLDSACKYNPEEGIFTAQKKIFQQSNYLKPYEELYKKANSLFYSRKYSEALIRYNELISNKPEIAQAYQNRATCFYFLGDYSKSILDIEKALSKGGVDEGFLINLRGVINLSYKKTDLACADFKLAIEKGSADAVTNYQKFCGKKN